jgi:membrane protein insertase Oxa1/YidC/SpoIIIJ
MKDENRESKKSKLQIFFAIIGAVFFVLFFAFLFLYWLLNTVPK